MRRYLCLCELNAQEVPARLSLNTHYILWPFWLDYCFLQANIFGSKMNSFYVASNEIEDCRWIPVAGQLDLQQGQAQDTSDDQMMDLRNAPEKGDEY